MTADVAHSDTGVTGVTGDTLKLLNVVFVVLLLLFFKKSTEIQNTLRIMKIIY